MRASHPNYHTTHIYIDTHTHTHTPQTHTPLSEQFTKNSTSRRNLILHNIPSTPPTCSLRPGLLWTVTDPEDQSVRPDPRPHSSKGLQVTSRTSGIRAEFDFRSKTCSLLLRRARLFRRRAGGKLHRHLATCMSSQTLHLAWGGGPSTTIKTIKHHRQSPPLSNVSTCENKPRITL